jgi:BCD family chlorophyll transporter-like MFS transporter
MLGFQTGAIARGNPVGLVTWLVLAGALFLFSLGSAFSGGTFLALIYDRSGESERGRAVGIVWTFLLLGFTIGGILFGLLLPSYETREMFAWVGVSGAEFETHKELLTVGRLMYAPQTIEVLFAVAGLMLGSLWFFSLLGEEKRLRGEAARESVEASGEHDTSMKDDLKLVWRSRPMRFFAAYLGLSMIFAFSQDLILEPFAAEVFNMDANHTTRFAAYWGSMSILGTVLFLWLSRKFPRLNNTVMSYTGVTILVVTFGLFAVCALFEIRGLVTIGLITLGLGLGIWNVGTLGLMMDMSPLERAGTFLGFWTLLVTFARGFGVSGGGIGRDVLLQLTGNLSLSYGLVFLGSMFGLVVSIWALRHVKVATFRRDELRANDTAAIFAGAME